MADGVGPAAILAGGAHAAARARARGGDETGPRDWAAAVRAFGTIEDKPTDPANGCLLSFFFPASTKYFFNVQQKVLQF